MNDHETKGLLTAIYGQSKWNGLDTPEKRQVWLKGYNHPEMANGTFHNADTESETFDPITFGADGQNITDYDAYYFVLGQAAPRICLRCGHSWTLTSRTLPGTCPKCKSPYWNNLRRNNIRKK